MEKKENANKVKSDEIIRLKEEVRKKDKAFNKMCNRMFLLEEAVKAKDDAIQSRDEKIEELEDKLAVLYKY